MVYCFDCTRHLMFLTATNGHNTCLRNVCRGNVPNAVSKYMRSDKHVDGFERCRIQGIQRANHPVPQVYTPNVHWNMKVCIRCATDFLTSPSLHEQEADTDEEDDDDQALPPTHQECGSCIAMMALCIGDKRRVRSRILERCLWDERYRRISILGKEWRLNQNFQRRLCKYSVSLYVEEQLDSILSLCEHPKSNVSRETITDRRLCDILVHSDHRFLKQQKGRLVINTPVVAREVIERNQQAAILDICSTAVCRNTLAWACSKSCRVEQWPVHKAVKVIEQIVEKAEPDRALMRKYAKRIASERPKRYVKMMALLSASLPALGIDIPSWIVTHDFRDDFVTQPYWRHAKMRRVINRSQTTFRRIQVRRRIMGILRTTVMLRKAHIATLKTRYAPGGQGYHLAREEFHRMRRDQLFWKAFLKQ